MPRRSPTVVAARKQKAMNEADMYLSVDSTTPPAPTQGAPWYFTVPAGFVAVLAVFRTIGAISRRRKNSTLEDRGYKRGGTASEDNYTKALKNVRTIHYEELPEEMMLAARRRRQQEVASEEGSMNLDEIELPDNHPFAVKNTLSAEEEELQRLRLSARRGLSPEDMRMLKQQQALADEMEEAAEERERRRAAAQRNQ